MKMKMLMVFLFIGMSTFAQTGGGRLCGPEFASLGLEGKRLDEVVEYAGVKHNEYQEYIYTSLLADPGVLTSKELQPFLKSKTTSFLNGIGITHAISPLPGNFDMLDSTFGDFQKLSFEAKEIFGQLESLTKSYNREKSVLFYSQLADLKQKALSISSFNESLAAASAISIAEHSFLYWENNLAKWMELFKSVGQNDVFGKGSPCDIQPKHIAGADVAGGVRGGVAGSFLGAAVGAFAGAVIGGAGSSTGAVLWEASKCIPVIGSVIKWLEDWF